MEKILAPSDYQALAELRYQIRRFLHFSEQAARNAGLEPQQHQLMLALKGLPEGVRPRIGELAERLQIQHHSAVELINRLAAAGYVKRGRHEPGPAGSVRRFDPGGRACAARTLPAPHGGTSARRAQRCCAPSSG